jgi:hypothetical protein
VRRLIVHLKNLLRVHWHYTIPGTEIGFEVWFWRWSNKLHVTHHLPEYVLQSEICRLRIN